MSAPDCLMMSCGKGLVAERLRHLPALLVEREAVRQHDVEGRAAARAAALEQRGLEPAAMLVGAFEIHHLVVAAVDFAVDAGKAGEVDGVFEHIGVGRAGVEPDVENVVDLLVIGGIVVGPRKRAAAPSAYQASAPSSSNASAMRALTRSSISGVVLALVDEHRDRHAPGALAAHHPVGLGADHAADAVLAGRRHPARLADRLSARSRAASARGRRRSACPSR